MNTAPNRVEFGWPRLIALVMGLFYVWAVWILWMVVSAVGMPSSVAPLIVLVFFLLAGYFVRVFFTPPLGPCIFFWGLSLLAHGGLFFATALSPHPIIAYWFLTGATLSFLALAAEKPRVRLGESQPPAEVDADSADRD